MTGVTTWCRHLFAGHSFRILASLWTVIIAVSFLWQFSETHRLIQRLATEQARAILERDLRYRLWNAGHGGVYVPITETTQPNQLLTVPDRDITTTTGKRLTLINPAFMNRQVYDLAGTADGIKAHLTSLRPLREQNAPDAWEAAALKSFEQGRTQALEWSNIDGQPYLRFMRPFITEQRCLGCHADQGYKVGDIRGGLAISVPFASMQGISDQEQRTHLINHGLVWLLGMVALIGLHRRIAFLGTQQIRLENEQQERIAFLQHLIDTIPHPIFYKDTDGRYRHVNAATLKALGRSRDQVLGRTVYEIAPGDLAEIYHAKDLALMAAGGTQVYQTELLFADGQRRPVEFTKTVFLRDGKPLGLVGMMVDLSERLRTEQALRASEMRFRQFFALNIAGLALHEIICNSAGQPIDYRFLDCNTAFEKLTGLQRDLIIGKTVLQVLPQTEPEWIQRFGKVALSGTTEHFENFSVAIGRWFEVAAFQTRPGQFAVVCQDITARKEIEEALRLAQAETVKAMEVKNRFLANMSHEIRTPLNGIIGLSNLLRRSPLAQDQAELVDMVQSSGQHLLTLINDILDLARLDAGRLTLEDAPVGLDELVGDLRRTIQPELTVKNLTFQVDIDPRLEGRIKADPLRLRQILGNLLGNALKFTERGGITLTLRSDRDTQGLPCCVLTVTDTGQGIPAEFLPHLFEPFTQADISATRQFGGAGLGLTIIKRLVDLMRGTITVASSPSGTSVVVTLPQQNTAGQEPPATVQAPAAINAASHQPSVLVVEDDPTNLTMTRMMLEEMGISCQVAIDGDEALAAIAQHHFDLVLLDCQLPKRDGYAVTRAVRVQEQEGKRHLPIIALTGCVQPEDRQRCLESGMDGILAKPFTFDALHQCLSAWLRKS